MAETNKAIAYERRQWCQLSQATVVVGGFIAIVMSSWGKKKRLRARPSAKLFNPLFIDFGSGRMFFLI